MVTPRNPLVFQKSQNILTRYEAMPLSEQPRNLNLVGRYAAQKTRHLAARLRADLQRAA